MANSYDRLRDTLKSHGYSYTLARQSVFKALREGETFTMNQLVAACSKDVDQTSVYRTIKLFESLGIVHRLQIGWKYKLELSDDYHSHHHHLTCNQCGRSQLFVEDYILESRLQKLAHKHYFQIQSHQIELVGICEVCSAKAQKQPDAVKQ